MKRVISVWLPRLATDRLSRLHAGAPHPDGETPALATVASVHGGQRLATTNEIAERRGLKPGLPLADARAVLPDVHIHPADPDADLALLERLCTACERYTPWTAIDPLGPRMATHPNAPTGIGAGLWLDVTGCAHLFGGEDALLADLETRFARAGFRTRAALAATPGAAWALARYGRAESLRPVHGEERSLLKALPVAALRLEPVLVEGLERMGLRRIEDLVHLPRAPLARRFGRIVLDRLDQAFGDGEEPISPRQAAPAHNVRRIFAEPIGRTEDIEACLAGLLPALCADLEAQGQGARTLTFSLQRVDNSHVRVEVGTSRPVHDPVHLARLFREKLADVDPGYGIEVAVLAAHRVGPLAPAQASLAPEVSTISTDHTGASRLIDRLANRLGPANVTRLAAAGSHLPECAAHERPALRPPHKSQAFDWTPPARRPPRPIKLLGQPLPIEVMASVPDGPPILLRWRSRSHRVVNAEGPERIEPEWWVNEGRPLSPDVRDYYRLEDEDGRRYWVYREGLYLPQRRPKWYLHGFFA